MFHQRFIVSLFALSIVLPHAHANWHDYRGPDGLGHTTAKNLPLKWSESENVTWKVPVPGQGFSTPLINGSHIWVTTAIVTPAKKQDIQERLKANTGSQPLILAEYVELRAICFDLKSGRQLHDVKLLGQKTPQWIHEHNSYASPSPVMADGMLYGHFGSYGTACLDTQTQKVLWANQDIQVMHENGPGSSPVLVGDNLIFHCDGSDKQFVVALNKRTGRIAWKVDRSGRMNSNPQLKKAYATPIVVELKGKKVVVSPGADWLYGYDPASGKELWRVAYGLLGFSNVARPVYGDGMIYTSTGFMKSEMLAVSLDGKPSVKWRHKRSVPKVPSPILVGDQLYMISDKGGILTCLDAKTGSVHFSKRMGGSFYASPLSANGRVYLFGREGQTIVIKPGTELKVLAENKLDGGHMASAATIDGALILRTDKALYRIGK